jgi:hypothetical protein
MKMHSTTLQDVYNAINPLPAQLTAKGKINPEVRAELEANAQISVTMHWQKRASASTWDREYKCFLGETFAKALGKATAFIAELPSAEQAVLHDFMGRLGKLIDAGKEDGIAVDFLNPLLDSMKRLSENVITYKPKAGTDAS